MEGNVVYLLIGLAGAAVLIVCLQVGVLLIGAVTEHLREQRYLHEALDARRRVLELEHYNPREDD